MESYVPGHQAENTDDIKCKHTGADSLRPNIGQNGEVLPVESHSTKEEGSGFSVIDIDSRESLRLAIDLLENHQRLEGIITKFHLQTIKCERELCGVFQRAAEALLQLHKSKGGDVASHSRLLVTNFMVSTDDAGDSLHCGDGNTRDHDSKGFPEVHACIQASYSCLNSIRQSLVVFLGQEAQRREREAAANLSSMDVADGLCKRSDQQGEDLKRRQIHFGCSWSKERSNCIEAATKYRRSLYVAEEALKRWDRAVASRGTCISPDAFISIIPSDGIEMDAYRVLRVQSATCLRDYIEARDYFQAAAVSLRKTDATLMEKLSQTWANFHLDYFQHLLVHEQRELISLQLHRRILEGDCKDQLQLHEDLSAHFDRIKADFGNYTADMSYVNTFSFDSKTLRNFADVSMQEGQVLTTQEHVAKQISSERSCPEAKYIRSNNSFLDKNAVIHREFFQDCMALKNLHYQCCLYANKIQGVVRSVMHGLGLYISSMRKMAKEVAKGREEEIERHVDAKSRQHDQGRVAAELNSKPIRQPVVGPLRFTPCSVIICRCETLADAASEQLLAWMRLLRATIFIVGVDGSCRKKQLEGGNLQECGVNEENKVSSLSGERTAQTRNIASTEESVHRRWNVPDACLSVLDDEDDSKNMLDCISELYSNLRNWDRGICDKEYDFDLNSSSQRKERSNKLGRFLATDRRVVSRGYSFENKTLYKHTPFSGHRSRSVDVGFRHSKKYGDDLQESVVEPFKGFGKICNLHAAAKKQYEYVMLVLEVVLDVLSRVAKSNLCAAERLVDRINDAREMCSSYEFATKCIADALGLDYTDVWTPKNYSNLPEDEFLGRKNRDLDGWGKMVERSDADRNDYFSADTPPGGADTSMATLSKDCAPRRNIFLARNGATNYFLSSTFDRPEAVAWWRDRLRVLHPYKAEDSEEESLVPLGEILAVEDLVPSARLIEEEEFMASKGAGTDRDWQYLNWNDANEDGLSFKNPAIGSAINIPTGGVEMFENREEFESCPCTETQDDMRLISDIVPERLVDKAGEKLEIEDVRTTLTDVSDKVEGHMDSKIVGNRAQNKAFASHKSVSDETHGEKRNGVIESTAPQNFSSISESTEEAKGAAINESGVKESADSFLGFECSIAEPSTERTVGRAILLHSLSEKRPGLRPPNIQTTVRAESERRYQQPSSILGLSEASEDDVIRRLGVSDFVLQSYSCALSRRILLQAFDFLLALWEIQKKVFEQQGIDGSEVTSSFSEEPSRHQSKESTANERRLCFEQALSMPAYPSVEVIEDAIRTAAGTSNRAHVALLRKVTGVGAKLYDQTEGSSPADLSEERDALSTFLKHLERQTECIKINITIMEFLEATVLNITEDDGPFNLLLQTKDAKLIEPMSFWRTTGHSIVANSGMDNMEMTSQDILGDALDVDQLRELLDGQFRLFDRVLESDIKLPETSLSRLLGLPTRGQVKDSWNLIVCTPDCVILDGKTYLTGVPYSRTFYTKIRIRLHAANAQARLSQKSANNFGLINCSQNKNEDPCIFVALEYEVCFVEWTMMQGQIRSNAGTQLEVELQKLSTFIRESIMKKFEVIRIEKILKEPEALVLIDSGDAPFVTEVSQETEGEVYEEVKATEEKISVNKGSLNLLYSCIEALRVLVPKTTYECILLALVLILLFKLLYLEMQGFKIKDNEYALSREALLSSVAFIG